MKYTIASIAIAVTLTACGSGGGKDDVTSSNIGSLNGRTPELILKNSDGKQVAFATDYTTDSNFVARARFNDDHIGAAPVEGVVTMDVTYGIVGYSNIREAYSTYNTTYYNYTGIDRTGDMEMVFDFNEGSFEGSDGTLGLSGTINGNELSGSSRYRGVNGKLDGSVDADEAVGVFAGNGSSVTYAGGFVGVAQ